MEKMILSTTQVKSINPIVLAFVGDAVHTLYVRQKLVFGSDAKAGILHKMASETVSAVVQSKIADKALELFDQEELDIFKRARNAHTHSSAKNADLADYKKASGYEAVLGYLYLTGQDNRLSEILKIGDEI